MLGVRPPAVLTGLCLSLALLLPACGGGDGAKTDKEGDKTREAAADAMLGGESKHDKAQKEDEERRKQAFQERKAKEEAEAARVKGIVDALVGLPDKLPGDLDGACQELIVEYEEYFKKIRPDDPGAILEFYENKGKNLGKRKAKCMKLGSIEAAACSVIAMKGAPEDLGAENEGSVFLACAEKYAPDALKNMGGAVDVAE